MGNFSSKFNEFKENAELIAKDMYTWVVPGVIAILFGLKDLLDFELYSVLINMVSAGAYAWLCYRFCQLLTKKKGTQINKQEAIIHSILKAVIVVLCTMIAYFLLTLVPFINLLEYVSVIGPAILYFMVISSLYLTVSALYPVKC